MDRIKTIFVITIILTELFATMSFAYEINVHSPLCNAAIGHSQLNKVLNNVGYNEGTEYYLKQTDIDGNIIKSQPIKTWISDGGKTEDSGKSGQDDFLTTRAFNHFHDPLQPWDNAFFRNPALTSVYSASYGCQPVSALIWGLKSGSQDFPQNTTGDWSWPKARQALYDSLTAPTQPVRDNYFADSLRALGQVMHLVQDMSVPAHTRNDTHVFPLTKIPFTDTGLEKPILGPWHYETYTWNWEKKYTKDFSEFLSNLSPVYPDQVVFTPSSNPDSQYASVAPASGLFDRNIYTDSSPPPSLDSNTVGLAEYTNANFFSDDTIWEYPHPAKTETNYRTTLRQARDGGVDTILHVYRSSDTQLTNPISAVRYFAEELYAGDPEIKEDFLDDDVFHGYATLLIPRAVGYSSSLIDYFFRGTLEISPPTEYVYSIIDGGNSPQQFTHIKANVRNTSVITAGTGASIPDATGDGELVAIAKYRIMPDYSEDLSAYPQSKTDLANAMEGVPVSYSVSKSITITSANSIPANAATEYLFDFSDHPIPVGVTDLYLQVVFRGTLGNEQNEAIAVGMKDLNEPQHLTFWNYTDYFLLNGTPVKAEDLESDPRVTWYGYIWPFSFNETLAFSKDYPDTAAAPVITLADLPPARYSRVILLSDASDAEYYVTDHIFAQRPPPPLGNAPTTFNETWKYSLPSTTAQQDTDGNWLMSPVYTVRGVRHHQGTYLMSFYPYFVYINSLPAPPENDLGPHPATNHFVPTAP